MKSKDLILVQSSDLGAEIVSQGYSRIALAWLSGCAGSLPIHTDIAQDKLNEHYLWNKNSFSGETWC